MGVTIIRRSAQATDKAHEEAVLPIVKQKKNKSGHTVPKKPLISLNEPGRLRVANVLYHLGVSHSCFYEGLRKGRYPRPDGYDQKTPFWRTETVRQFLEG